MASLKYWLWLTTRNGMAPKETFALLERFGTPEAVYFADDAEYEYAGVSPELQAALKKKDLSGAERILADCDRLGIRILTIQDAEYPERLRQLADPPCVLYVKGRMLAFDEEVVIAIVGSRKPTEYGVYMAGKLSMELARAGAVVVSGIARGIDAAALRGALQGGGRVVSVLGGGIDMVYPPEHKWLYADVAAAGALISEYPPGSRNLGWHFPVRNRIISGLAVGVCAVEGAEGSGTMITTRLALDQNREVFAVPGNAEAPMSRGTNLLIQRSEAKLVMRARDILCEFESRFPGVLRHPEPLSPEAEKARLESVGETPEREKEPEKEPVSKSGENAKTVDKPKERAYITLKDEPERFTDDERDILLALGESALRVDDVVEATQIPARRVSSALTMLQLQGLVTEQPGKRFEAAVVLKCD